MRFTELKKLAQCEIYALIGSYHSAWAVKGFLLIDSDMICGWENLVYLLTYSRNRHMPSLFH